MRRFIIAGNWKMNKTIVDAIELANGIKRELYDIESLDIVICTPFTALSEVGEVVVDSNIDLGGQDLFWEEKGAYTGEISAGMLKDAGCKYVIIGHSERRKHFAETNETVNKKLKSALKTGLLPIVCVGERLEEREAKKTFDVIKDHVENSLKGISKEDILKTTIAYEPVWAIGTGKTATPEQAEEVHAFIRGLLTKLYDEATASAIRIQYGGSVTPDNVEGLLGKENIDGALVGGASLKLDSFSSMIKKASKLK
ncbi:MAG: triose-phosphate isomerase [Candidatus Omnitrophica bacterium]|nr:triose-phosphate isomerase [Candidatus Omnitrophota bacterium]